MWHPVLLFSKMCSSEVSSECSLSEFGECVNGLRHSTRLRIWRGLPGHTVSRLRVDTYTSQGWPASGEWSENGLKHCQEGSFLVCFCPAYDSSDDSDVSKCNSNSEYCQDAGVVWRKQPNRVSMRRIQRFPDGPGLLRVSGAESADIFHCVKAKV